MGKYHCDFTITKPALVALKDYEKQKKKEKIQYSIQVLGIKNADFWEHEYGKDKKEEVS